MFSNSVTYFSTMIESSSPVAVVMPASADNPGMARALLRWISAFASWLVCWYASARISWFSWYVTSGWRNAPQEDEVGHIRSEPVSGEMESLGWGLFASSTP